MGEEIHHLGVSKTFPLISDDIWGHHYDPWPGRVLCFGCTGGLGSKGHHPHHLPAPTPASVQPENRTETNGSTESQLETRHTCLLENQCHWTFLDLKNDLSCFFFHKVTFSYCHIFKKCLKRFFNNIQYYFWKYGATFLLHQHATGDDPPTMSTIWYRLIAKM